MKLKLHSPWVNLFVVCFVFMAFGGVSKGTDGNRDEMFRQYTKASALGAARGVFALPFEHPFDCVKTKLQSAPKEMTSPTKLARIIYQTEGLSGFYAGVVPNTIRQSLKQGYRWPLMLALPGYYDRILSTETREKHPTLRKSLTGLTIANFEVFIITPLERMKVWLMTSIAKERTLRSLFAQENTTLGRELFRGVNAVYPKQMVSWVSFLAYNDIAKRKMKSWSGSNDLTYSQLMMIAVGGGIINTTLIMPFDCVKTHMQKHGPFLEDSVFKKKKVSLFESGAFVLKKYGFWGFYRGWGVRMTQYILHGFFTVNLLEYLEKSWEHPEN